MANGNEGRFARMVEDHTPPDPKRWPSGWWLIPAFIIGTVLWIEIFTLT
jgi:hypothetical protein